MSILDSCMRGGSTFEDYSIGTYLAESIVHSASSFERLLLQSLDASLGDG